MAIYFFEMSSKNPFPEKYQDFPLIIFVEISLSIYQVEAQIWTLARRGAAKGGGLGQGGVIKGAKIRRPGL